GAASGAAIGLIEELRKEAWLVITGGPLTGKQFILYNAMTTIGSSPKCDIALLKDQMIAPQHCVLEIAGAQHTLRDLGTQTGTAVNGRPIQRHPLRRGDIIQIGQTTLEYQDRAVG
ncbi:MAG: FHA domain-containing protein, partial [Armatimonadota bacterium]